MFVNGIGRGRRKVRRVQHLGVQALAEQMGLSPGHVCRVLRGERQSSKVLAAARTSGLIKPAGKRVGK
jgi:hypothetical protein